MSNEDLKQAVIDWANNKNLINPANIKSQFMKLVEEVGELSEAINKNKPGQIVDTLGDIQVVLIILSEQLGYNYDNALELAYGVIKGRHGKMIDGTFVKDEDLES